MAATNSSTLMYLPTTDCARLRRNSDSMISPQPRRSKSTDSRPESSLPRLSLAFLACSEWSVPLSVTPQKCSITVSGEHAIAAPCEMSRLQPSLRLSLTLPGSAKWCLPTLKYMHYVFLTLFFTYFFLPKSKQCYFFNVLFFLPYRIQPVLILMSFYDNIKYTVAFLSRLTPPYLCLHIVNG